MYINNHIFNNIDLPLKNCEKYKIVYRQQMKIEDAYINMKRLQYHDLNFLENVEDFDKITKFIMKSNISD